MKKSVKIIVISLLSVIGAILLTAIAYICYVLLQYDRIDDALTVQIEGNTTAVAQVNETYTATTYNVGFGAYSPSFSFFMDSGVIEGKTISGKYGKATSLSEVQKNTSGAATLLKNSNSDFIFAQEVDTDSDRSYHVNQLDSLCLEGYSSAFANNYHSAYLFYPFSDPIGKSNSGILTLSRYKMDSCQRRALPLATDLSKFFDLDRCISISRLPLENSEKQLVLINVHLSAYDEGGVIRAQQTDMLCGILSQESENGNYVVVGGDFNQLLALTEFPTKEDSVTWASPFPKEKLPEGYAIHATQDTPTCRNANMPYEKGVSYTCVIDGFITSSNIAVADVSAVNDTFEYSDHNPVKMTFTLTDGINPIMASSKTNDDTSQDNDSSSGATLTTGQTILIVTILSVIALGPMLITILIIVIINKIQKNRAKKNRQRYRPY